MNQTTSSNIKNTKNKFSNFESLPPKDKKIESVKRFKIRSFKQDLIRSFHNQINGSGHFEYSIDLNLCITETYDISNDFINVLNEFSDSLVSKGWTSSGVTYPWIENNPKYISLKIN